MKRTPELRGLSEDHHHGLVLARKARMAGSGEEGFEASAIWAEVETKFKTELEPHFQVEESWIGAVLDARGESKLAGRLLEEHAVLRRFVAAGQPRTRDALEKFGELLEKHIRFEERELFEVAQAALSRHELADVARAWRARRSIP